MRRLGLLIVSQARPTDDALEQDRAACEEPITGAIKK
jgi:hypothetical protein